LDDYPPPYGKKSTNTLEAHPLKLIGEKDMHYQEASTEESETNDANDDSKERQIGYSLTRASLSKAVGKTLNIQIEFDRNVILGNVTS
ncbi:hypothetical protein NPIL_336061, partial [Nephila pilipes]